MSDMMAVFFFAVSYLFVGLVLLSYSLGGALAPKKMKLVSVKARRRDERSLQ